VRLAANILRFAASGDSGDHPVLDGEDEVRWKAAVRVMAVRVGRLGDPDD
jgi:hypothetical protein